MSDQVGVDWTACRARGTCSELLPERIRLDEWGYPLIDPAPITGDLRRFAQMAVDACPTRALRLQKPAPDPAQNRAQNRSALDTQRRHRTSGHP